MITQKKIYVKGKKVIERWLFYFGNLILYFRKGKFFMKEKICMTFGILGGFISSIFGGWTAALNALLIFILIDYLTGMIVAGVFHKSKKTQNGGLESHTGFKGLCQKAMIFLIVIISYHLDLILGSEFIRDSVILAFIANETISIIENASLMGIPIPEPISRAIDLLNQKNRDKEN